MKRPPALTLVIAGAIVGAGLMTLVHRMSRPRVASTHPSGLTGQPDTQLDQYSSQINDLLAGRLETRTQLDGREIVRIGQGYAAVPVAIRLLLESGYTEITDPEARKAYLDSAIEKGFDLLRQGDSKGMAFLIFAGDQHHAARDYRAGADLWARVEREAQDRKDRALAAAMMGQNLELLGEDMRAEQAYRRVIDPQGGIDVSPGGADREVWEPYLRAARGLAGLSLAEGNISAAAQANLLIVENSSAQDLRRPDVRAALEEALWMANRAERYDDTIRVVDHVLAIDPDFGMNTSRRLSLELQRARAIADGGQDAATFAHELTRLWDEPRNHGYALTANLASNLVSSLSRANKHLETILYAEEALAEIAELTPTLSKKERELYAGDSVVAQIMLSRAIALNTLGREDEAIGALMEIMERYPGSHEAQIAGMNLREETPRTSP